MAFSNEFSYSNSRAGMYNNGCKRAYYLHYYGSWNGWNDRAPAIKKEAYFLKKLTSRYAWAGTLFHEAIADLLHTWKREQRIIPPEDLQEKALEKMKSQWKISKGRVKSRVAKQFGLREHELNMRVSQKQWDQIKARVYDGIRAFYDSTLLEEAMGVPVENWLYIDDDSFNTFQVKTAGVTLPVFSIPDFALKREDGTVVIYDWKTGKPKGAAHKAQLALYALYAVNFWGVSPDQVEVVLFYSGTGDIVREQITTEDVKNAANDIKSFVEDIRGRLVDGDTAANKPKRKMIKSGDNMIATKEDDLELWPLTDDTGDCFWCNYERICGIREKMNV